MTGDGVNDAPAIKEANIDIAMGRAGTEVTRATADMILMDDTFATIVGAIEEWRGTYDNIRRTVRYTLATNIAEVVLMLGAVLLAVLPVHLLWVNLVCDGLPALSLGYDRPAPGVTDRPPRRAETGLFVGGLWRRKTVRGLALGAGILGLFGVVLGATGNVVLTRSAAMAALIFSKLLFLLEVRRDGARGRGLPPNPFLTGAFLLTGVLVLGSIYLPAVQPFFKTVGPGGRRAGRRGPGGAAGNAPGADGVPLRRQWRGGGGRNVRIKQVHLLVAPQELARFLTEHLNMGGVTNLAAATEEGLLRIRCSYRLGFVPIPVDLAVRVVTVAPELVELQLAATGGAMVEEILLGMVRGSKLSYLQVQGGRLLLRVDQLAASLGGEGRLQRFAFRPEGIELGVEDLVLPPPPSGRR